MTINNILIVIIIAILLVLGFFGYYLFSQKDTEDQAIFELQEKQSQDMIDMIEIGTAKEEAEPSSTQDFEKYENEIQDLLNKQCQALLSKNLGLLISTVDQSDKKAFQEYKQSTDILLSMTDSVVKCQYEIQNIQFNENTKELMAETTEKGDLQIRLIDGSLRIIEDQNILTTGKYIQGKNEWKQIISTKN